jgi:hypothetical protein
MLHGSVFYAIVELLSDLNRRTDVISGGLLSSRVLPSTNRTSSSACTTA